jgi:methionyl-tRNA formyltransferase
VRVLFWGTPEFAAPALRALVGEGFDVVGVVTQPDKPVGRSRSTLQAPPIKQIAVEEGIPVFQPERPRGAEFVSGISELEPDISVVVAYGHLLPRAVIDLPRLGTINIHASLLPLLRGAAPIQAAIRGGLTETGVTIMRMVQALDAGPMILKVATPIVEDETYGELALRLSEIGALACIEALALMDLGKAVEEAQDDAAATYAPKITRESTLIDWAADARTVGRVIRAYDPRPGALSSLRGQDVKLFGARPAPRTSDQAPGVVTAVDDGGMVVACGQGAVRVAAIQPSGKRRMQAAELSRGRGIAVGDVLGTGNRSGP